MKRRAVFLRLWLCTLGIILLAGTSVSLAAQFQADMVETRKGRTKTDKIYFLDHQYRLDVEEDGQPLNILVATMPLPPPDWAGQIASAPVMGPPFETTLSEGQILRIKPVRDFNVDLKVKSLSGLEGFFSSNAFKDGRPLKIITGFSGGGRKVHTETPDEADEIVVRATSGRIVVAAQLVKAAAVQASPFPKAAEASETKPTGTARMVLILDGSGSMWGQIDGKAKIDIAKEVINDLIAKIPAGFQTGLMVYGHRRKGDCNDIEMVVPLGPHNPAAMQAKVKAISPKGKTPLSAAVKQAAQALRYTEARATVVLVSDGLETCDIDPCELAAELAMSGVDFTVHVIGFDISREDQERLRCLADKTGGLFLAADNADSLRKALFATVEKVQEPPPPVVEDPGTATLNGPPTVPVGAAFEVAWQGPDSQRDYVAISKKDSADDQYQDYTYTLQGNPVRLTAPADIGEYELRYVHGHSGKVIGRAAIKVTPVEALVRAPASADVAGEFKVEWQGPAYQSDYISVARPDQQPGNYIDYTYISEGNPLKVRAPSEPGTYEVRYILGHGNKLLARTTLEIKAVTASVQAPASVDAAAEFEVAWQGPGNNDDYISVARPGQEGGDYVAYSYAREGNPVKLRAPSEPGTYEVRYILGHGNKLLARTTLEIKAVGASVQAPASVAAAAEFEVAWQGPGNNDDYISVARPGQEGGDYVAYSYAREGNPVKLRAPSDAGSYEVRYILGQGNKLLAGTTMEVNAVSASLQAPATAQPGSEIAVQWQGPGYDGDYICISQPGQDGGDYKTYTYISQGNPCSVETPVKPGAYEVRYIMNQGNRILARVPITIK